MEIERKFLIQHLPCDVTQYPCLHIEQAYLNRNPDVRVRKSNDDYFITVKGIGNLAREEFETKIDVNLIKKYLSKVIMHQWCMNFVSV